MHPLSPVVPSAEADETVYAKDQPQYIPLPSIKTPDGVMLTRWSVNETEKRQIAGQGYIYLIVNTFNQPLQPVMMSTNVPEDMGFETRPLEDWPSEIDG
jgi:hypothetical protein